MIVVSTAPDNAPYYPRFYASLLEHWEQTIPVIYTDAQAKELFTPKFREAAQIHESESKQYVYLYQATRFAHKGFSLINALTTTTHRYAVWLDADTVTFKEIGEHEIANWLDGHCIAGLAREGGHSETGFIAFDRWHDDFPEFLRRYKNMYHEARIFDLKHWTDCHAFDWSREGLSFKNLSPEGKGVDHVFVTSVLGEYMDHLKGNRKQLGFSPEHPLVQQV